MNQSTQTQARVSPLMAVIFRLLNYVEIIGLAAAGVGYAMLYSSMRGAPEILTISLSVLAAVFFLRGYQPPAPQQKDGDDAQLLGFSDLLSATILPKVGWIACSVATVGIQFRLLNLKGNDEMLIIGCSVLIIALFLSGILIVSKPERSAGLMQLVYRAVPLCMVGLYLFMNKPA